MKFKEARDEAFTEFMSQYAYTPSYIAIYIDDAQKNTFKTKTKVEMEAIIDRIMNLFVLLKSKDQFIFMYERLLADRLLNKLSISDEAEEYLISHLQVQGG